MSPRDSRQLCEDCLWEAKDKKRAPADRRPWVVVRNGVHVCALHSSRRRRAEWETEQAPAKAGAA